MFKIQFMFSGMSISFTPKCATECSVCSTYSRLGEVEFGLGFYLMNRKRKRRLKSLILFLNIKVNLNGLKFIF